MVILSKAHSKKVQGASKFINEVDESIRVVNRVEQICNEIKKNSIITYQETTATNKNDNLNNIIKFHNSKSKDLNISLHFNSATFKQNGKDIDYTDKPIGIEIFYCSDKGKAQARKYQDKLVKVSGLIDRGIKYDADYKKLGFLRNTTGTSILIELCFVNSKKDVEIYKNKFEDICIALAELITGEKYIKKSNVEKGVYQVVTQSFSHKENAIKYQEELKKKGVSSFLQYREV